MKTEATSRVVTIFTGEATMSFTEAAEMCELMDSIQTKMMNAARREVLLKVKASGMMIKDGTWDERWLSPRDTGVDFVARVTVEAE